MFYNIKIKKNEKTQDASEKGNIPIIYTRTRKSEKEMENGGSFFHYRKKSFSRQGRNFSYGREKIQEEEREKIEREMGKKNKMMKVCQNHDICFFDTPSSQIRRKNS